MGGHCIGADGKQILPNKLHFQQPQISRIFNAYVIARRPNGPPHRIAGGMYLIGTVPTAAHKGTLAALTILVAESSDTPLVSRVFPLLGKKVAGEVRNNKNEGETSFLHAHKTNFISLNPDHDNSSDTVYTDAWVLVIR